MFGRPAKKTRERSSDVPATWQEVCKHIVNYGEWDGSFKDTFRERRSVVIRGRPGLGKSTYLLWAISSVLSDKDRKEHNGAIKAWFSQAVFLDRTQPGLWPELIAKDFNPDSTVVVIDGLFEIDDDESRAEEKLRALKAIARKFRLAITVRDDEYEAHAKAFNAFAEVPDLKWDKVRFWQIFQKRLQAWGRPGFRDDQLIELDDDLRKQSENAPIYLELLASELADPDEGVSLNKLKPEQLRRYINNLPKGMINLVWQIVWKICHEKAGEKDPILFLLKLFERLNISLSNHFQGEAVSILCSDSSERKRASAQLARLQHYLGEGDKRDPRDLGDPRFNKLWSNHWREALARAGKSTDPPISSEYRDIMERYVLLDYEQLRDSFCEKLAEEISSGIRSVPRAVICSDIIKVRASSANRVTNQWVKSRTNYPDSVLRNRLDDLIFDSWLAGAFAAHDPEQRNNYFHAAFELSFNFDAALRKVEETKPLNRCITLQRNSLLPFLEGSKFDDGFRDTISLCTRLIGLDKNDATSKRSLANLYWSIGDFDSADRQFREAAGESDSPNLELVFTLIEWGKCLHFWDNDDRAEKYLTSQSYSTAALANFDKAWEIINALEKGDKVAKAVLGDVAEAKRRLRTAHAIALKGSEPAEELLRDNLKENPNDPPTLNALAHLLLTYRKIGEARQLLEPLTDEQLAVPDVRSLRILGLSYIQFYTSAQEKDFARAEGLFIRARDAASQRASNPYDRRAQTAQVSADLAKLYLDWVDQKPLADPSEVLSKAKYEIEGILQLPKNPMWARHFSAVQSSLRQLRDRGGPSIQSENPLEQADNPSDWYAVAASAWSTYQGSAVTRAYRGWLESLQRLPERNWSRLASPEMACNILHWVGLTYAQVGEANDLVFAGRYYASLCYALRGSFPLSVEKYPSSSRVAEFRWERKLYAARLGHKDARGVQIQSCRNRLAGARGQERLLFSAILAELQGEESAVAYAELAAKVFADKWNPQPKNLRLLADGLLFQGERDKSADLWNRVCDRVEFPESFFACLLASAIAHPNGGPPSEEEIEEYTGDEEFINKGEVYTAYKKVKEYMKQAHKDLFIIDPYMGGQVVDMLSTLNSSIEVRILTNHVLGDFKTGFQKLQKQRGKMEARRSDHFHDRFLILDGRVCYHLGSSIKDMGARATVIAKKEESTTSRIVSEAETIWQGAAALW
jgi:hypothetical protein